MQQRIAEKTITFDLSTEKAAEPAIDPTTNPAYTAEPNVPSSTSSIFKSLFIS